MDETPPTRPIDPATVLPVELHGERVLLRRWHLVDAAALFEAIDGSRERLRPWMPWEAETRFVADVERYIEGSATSMAQGSDLALGIWHRATGGLLGATGLHDIDWAVPSFSIGYWIRDGEEGKGLVEESVRLLVSHLFADLGAERIVITCDVENTRSRRIPERIGFVLEGRLRSDRRTPHGALRDTLVYSLRRDDPVSAVDPGARPNPPGPG